MFNLTPAEQFFNRSRLKLAIEDREDEPLRGDLRDGFGSFCFLGLCLETMRKNNPDEYIWKGSRLVPVDCDVAFPLDVKRTNEDLCDWLGVEEQILWSMPAYNDDVEHFSWKELWEKFDQFVKDKEGIDL